MDKQETLKNISKEIYKKVKNDLILSNLILIKK